MAPRSSSSCTKKRTAPAPRVPSRRGKNVTTISYTLLATGGAALAGGLTWWIVDAQKPQKGGYALTVDASGVALVGRF